MCVVRVKKKVIKVYENLWHYNLPILDSKSNNDKAAFEEFWMGV